MLTYLKKSVSCDELILQEKVPLVCFAHSHAHPLRAAEQVVPGLIVIF